MQWTGLWPQLRQAEEMEPLTPQKRLGLPLPDDRMIDFFLIKTISGTFMQWSCFPTGVFFLAEKAF